ncbi:MAG: KAP family NTPase [Thiobacillus sp.]|nr:KAP family NTPase [Thiobacillus sp.]
MKIVTPALVVEELDAFKNDALERKSFGEALLNLVMRSNDELVISLDGKWGEGKTTFIRMWQGLLANEGVPSIYIDAFQNDYVEDAFISIASAITSYVDAHSEGGNNGSAFKEKAKKVGVQLLSWSAKVGIKAATLGAIKETDIEALADIKNDVATGTSGVIADFIKERLSSYTKDVELVRSFRTELSELPSKLKDNNSNRLIIVIDELDRCKPSFAVEVLEKIKHLFSVPNVVFVLVMHKEQLEEAIRSVYGQNIDAHTYLQKFINIETTIPKRINDRYKNDLGIYSRKLLQIHELETWGDEKSIVDCLDPLVQHFDFSLRQLEKVYTNLAIIYGTSKKNHLRLVPIITFISVIKVVSPSLFGRIQAGRISFSELREEIGMVEVDGGNADQRKLYWVMNWVKFAMLSEDEFKGIDANDPVNNFGETLWKYSVERERLLPIFCQQLSMFVVN